MLQVLHEEQFDLSALRPWLAPLLEATAKVFEVDAAHAAAIEHLRPQQDEERAWDTVNWRLERTLTERLDAWLGRLDTLGPRELLQRTLLLVRLHEARLLRSHPAWSPEEERVPRALYDRAALLLDLLLACSRAAFAAADRDAAWIAPATLREFVASQLALRLLGDEQDSQPLPAAVFETRVWSEPRALLPLVQQVLAGHVRLHADGRWSADSSAGTVLAVSAGVLGAPRRRDRFARRFARLLEHALRHGQATAAAAAELYRTQPGFTPYYLLGLDPRRLDRAPELANFVRFLWQRLQDEEAAWRLRPAQALEHDDLLPDFSPPVELDNGDADPPSVRLVGGEALLWHCRWREAQLEQPSDRVVQHHFYWPLARIEALQPGESRAELVARLRELRPAALEAAFGTASELAESLLFEALQRTELEPLRQWRHAHAARCRHEGLGSESRLPVHELRPLLAPLAQAAFEWFCTVYLHATEGGSLATLLRGLRGDRAEALLHSALHKHAHVPIMAIGLLPLPEGEAREAACLERYLQLKALDKEAGRYGAERRAHHQAAVTVGLAHLAAVAGYDSLGSLEWAMEARQGEQVAAWFEPRTIGGYQVHIELHAETTGPVVVNAKGKRLATAPTALRKHPQWLALKTAWVGLKEQRRRFVAALERRLVDATAMGQAQLDSVMDHPLMADLAQRLVWQDEAGGMGLYRRDGLEGPDGLHGPCGSLRLVHPVELLRQGRLADWQRWLVERGVVQPFKQVFREIYVPTPAELKAGDRSARYAGRWLRTRPAQALFKARDWAPAGWRERALALHRRHFADGVLACFDFHFDGHCFTEPNELESDLAWFERDGRRLALSEVPPVTFSEAMRDLDLVVARSLGGDDAGYGSPATVQARRELLQALLPALAPEPGALTLGKRYVHVRGRLAQYRIHLVSGHIHIEPGACLCVIPAPEAAAGARQPPRLPYEEEDAKSAEILSKLLLLLDDDRIRDESIRRQIVGRRS
ncbi:DUF4132 domain-containing protein [Aquabacterium sp. A7-Y]|uniref:DUF4132 domain-containing protein n=1 Tax=Aquabacterium sp. A7-Y TaxID=1349605 RepID=UPI00223E835E|nr:DUF4132 domain-containing protein [Aquabacterium sp. A7-Y]MCW7536563.1 DUF4132 domain-containing protein [Aquabacterium sp. A7-Y]